MKRILVLFPKGLAREMKWLGSYRYAVLNMGASSSDDLQRGFHAIGSRLFAE